MHAWLTKQKCFVKSIVGLCSFSCWPELHPGIHKCFKGHKGHCMTRRFATTKMSDMSQFYPIIQLVRVGVCWDELIISH